MARAMAQSHWRAAPPFLSSRELEVLVPLEVQIRLD